MLNTFYQLAAIIGALIPVAGFFWWLISPRLASLAKQVEPDPTKQHGDAPEQTLREMQVEQTETMHRMESKLDERLTEFGLRLQKVEKAVEPIPSLVEKVEHLSGRVTALEQAGK